MTSKLRILEDFVQNGRDGASNSRLRLPPSIGETLGFRLISVGESTASVEIHADPERHANPMGTLHGGVLCDIADYAVGTAHMTTLEEDDSFTSIDLHINFFRPVWKEHLVAEAKPVQQGKTLSRYVCDITNTDGKLVAQVASTVMTLKGDRAKGR